jgi:hypothetical protein
MPSLAFSELPPDYYSPVIFLLVCEWLRIIMIFLLRYSAVAFPRVSPDYQGEALTAAWQRQAVALEPSRPESFCSNSALFWEGMMGKGRVAQNKAVNLRISKRRRSPDQQSHY